MAHECFGEFLRAPGDVVRAGEVAAIFGRLLPHAQRREAVHEFSAEAALARTRLAKDERAKDKRARDLGFADGVLFTVNEVCSAYETELQALDEGAELERLLLSDPPTLHGSILQLLLERGTRLPKEISEALGESPPTVTRALRVLRDHGLAEVAPVSNGTVRPQRLTPRGRRWATRVPAQARGLDELLVSLELPAGVKTAWILDAEQKERKAWQPGKKVKLPLGMHWVDVVGQPKRRVLVVHASSTIRLDPPTALPAQPRSLLPATDEVSSQEALEQHAAAFARSERCGYEEGMAAALLAASQVYLRWERYSAVTALNASLAALDDDDQRARTAPNPGRVCVVDDKPSERAKLRKAFEKAGFSVTTLASLQE